MHSLKKPIVTLLTIGATGVLIAGCSGNTKDQNVQQRDADTRNKTVGQLINSQPAETMTYSPTRETINYWIKTWGKQPGKLSYVYLQSSTGDLLGYYVLEGLPVSYCASITRTYDFVDTPKDGSDVRDQQVRAPGVDGVWYGGGGSCNTYYGKDASSKAYVEYTAGLGINVLLYDRPLARQDVKPLGPTTVDEAKKLK